MNAEIVLVTTLPSDPNHALLEKPFPSGVVDQRICRRDHSAKMSKEQLVDYVFHHEERGLRCVVDTAGPKPRTTRTGFPFVYEERIGRENHLYPARLKQEVLLVAEGTTDGEITVLKEKFGLEPETFVMRANFLPEMMVGKRSDGIYDELSFADGDLVCRVDQIEKEGKRPFAAKLTVIHQEKDQPFYGDMGFIGANFDIFTQASDIFSPSDKEKLTYLAEKCKTRGEWPNQVALSFVSNIAQLEKALAFLDEIEVPQEVGIAAKIETLEGVENVAEIARRLGKRGTIVIARGDLGEACKAEGRDLDEVVQELKANLQGVETTIVMAANVFNSARRQTAEKQPFLNLSREEIARLDEEAQWVDEIWLTTESANIGRRWPEATLVVHQFLLCLKYAGDYDQSHRVRTALRHLLLLLHQIGPA